MSSMAFSTYAQNNFGKIDISLPVNWSYQKDLFGLPHVFLGQKIRSNRPSLAVVPSENDKIILDDDMSSETQNTFYSKRKSWVEMHEGKVVEFVPYKKNASLKIPLVHQFEFHYMLNNEIFIEKSLYFHCRKELFHLKSLVLKKDLQGQAELENIIKSLMCKS